MEEQPEQVRIYTGRALVGRRWGGDGEPGGTHTMAFEPLVRCTTLCTLYTLERNLSLKCFTNLTEHLRGTFHQKLCKVLAEDYQHAFGALRTGHLFPLESWSFIWAVSNLCDRLLLFITIQDDTSPSLQRSGARHGSEASPCGTSAALSRAPSPVPRSGGLGGGRDLFHRPRKKAEELVFWMFWV